MNFLLSFNTVKFKSSKRVIHFILRQKKQQEKEHQEEMRYWLHILLKEKGWVKRAKDLENRDKKKKLKISNSDNNEGILCVRTQKKKRENYLMLCRLKEIFQTSLSIFLKNHARFYSTIPSTFVFISVLQMEFHYYLKGTYSTYFQMEPQWDMGWLNL